VTDLSPYEQQQAETRRKSWRQGVRWSSQGPFFVVTGVIGFIIFSIKFGPRTPDGYIKRSYLYPSMQVGGVPAHSLSGSGGHAAGCNTLDEFSGKSKSLRRYTRGAWFG